MASERLVLVVDDDAIVLRILADQIARAGYEVTPVASIAEARRQIEQTLFAVVVADQSMPELSGIDFLRECAAIQPFASRVLVTGNVGLSEVDHALREGEICRLLIKPWTRFDLISLFEQVYERYELLSQREQLRNKIVTLENQIANLNAGALGSESPAAATPAAEPGREPAVKNGWRTAEEIGDERQLPVFAGVGRETFVRMASRIAHEFNNALIPILGYVELMLEKDQLIADKEKARQYLKLVLAAAKDANRVADRLREFYQQAEQSDAATLVEANQAELDSLSGKAAQLDPSLGKRVGRALKVLVVDDEKTSRDVVALILKADHHEITPASSGAEALQILRYGSYDLLVTDQEMPGMNGTALVEAVRKSKNSPAIIMLTGFGELMKGSGSTPEGVDLILNKPVTSEGLLLALTRLFPNDVVDA
jgi:CheY-like chemotaxis protein